MPFFFLSSQTQISSSLSLPDIATELESGAEKSQLHFIAYVLRFLVFGPFSALIPSLHKVRGEPRLIRLLYKIN